MKKENTFRNKFFLSLSVLTFSATQLLLFTLFPFLAETLSLPLADIVLYFTLGTTLFLFGSPFWTDQSDSRGRRNVIRIGLVGLAVSFGIVAYLIEFQRDLEKVWIISLLIASRFVYGLFASAIVPVCQLARKDMATKDQHLSSMLSHSLALSLGRSLGPMAFLMFAGEIKNLFYFFSLAPLLLILLSLRHSLDGRQNVELKKSSWMDSAIQIKLPLLVTVLFTLYVGILHSSLGYTIGSIFHLKGLEASRLVAEVLLVGSVVMSISQILGKIILKNNFRAGIFSGLVFLTLGAFILAFMSQRSELWIAIALISSGIALIQPSHLAIVHHLFPEDKVGQKIGLLSSGNTIGYALGGGLTALLLDFDIHKLSLAIIFLLIVSAVGNTLRVRSC